MSLCRIVYLSESAKRMRRRELKSLVREAAEKNHARGISGLLLHSGGNFIQVLEGEMTRVSNLYAKIVADDRHKAIRTLTHHVADSRLFPEWGMELADVWRMKTLDHEAVDKALIRLRLAHDNIAESQAIILLQEFRRQLMNAA